MFMNTAHPTSSAADPGPRDPAQSREAASAQADENAVARQVRLLERLAEAGMGLARIAAVRVTETAGAGENADIGERADAFAKVARAVRQTIGLEVKLRADRRACDRDPATDAATRRQLRLLKELAEISFAVAAVPANLGAVPVFLRVARAVRQTIGAAANLRKGRRAPDPRANPASSRGSAAEPGSDPAAEESEGAPLGGGDIASALTETLDAFNEYYRFVRMPIDQAVALVFKSLGVPVETGSGPAEGGAEPDPAPAPAAAGTGDAAAPESERSQARLEPDPRGAGNRGPP
jgi:hypothetical protein